MHGFGTQTATMRQSGGGGQGLTDVPSCAEKSAEVIDSKPAEKAAE